MIHDYTILRDADLAFAYTLATMAYQVHALGCPECEGLRTMIGGGVCQQALALLAPIAAIEMEQAARLAQLAENESSALGSHKR